MGVGLIQLCTAIVMVTLRLYFGNIRMESNAGNMILVLEELMEANNRYSKRINEIDKEQRYWNRDLIDSISDTLNQRSTVTRNKRYYCN